MTGWNLVEENANYDRSLAGRLWGKSTLTLDAGGVWESVFTGVRIFENGQPKEIIHAVGHGRGGLVDGMQLRLTMVQTFPRSPCLAQYRERYCRSLAPNEKFIPLVRPLSAAACS